MRPFFGFEDSESVCFIVVTISACSPLGTARIFCYDYCYMKYAVLLVVAGCVWVNVAHAALFMSNDEPFPTLNISEQIDTTNAFYGKLDDSPHTYEFTTNKTFTLTAAIYTPRIEEPQKNLYGIIVRVKKEGGVEEVARLGGGKWEAVRDRSAAITYLTGPTYEATLGAGTYRFEVSTPDNIGYYKLVIGNEKMKTSFSEVREVRAFYGLGSFGLIASPYIYQPIGILIFGYLIYRTWRRRRHKPQEV